MEAVVAYSHAAMTDYLGQPSVGSSASIATADQLSREAMLRCRRLTDLDAEKIEPVGVALVAALPTSSIRRGDDSIHVSITVGDATQSWSRNLPKGEFTRESAENIADTMFYETLASLIDAKA